MRFRPSLPVHARRLMDTLGVQVVEDETAPAGCACGCRYVERGVRLTTDPVRVDPRAIAERTRARLRAETCPTHGERLVEHGQVCRSCQREAVPPTEQAV